MKATAIWMDSARVDAHNLDDLYERWQLRKRQEIQKAGLIQFYVPPPKIVIPDDPELAAQLRLTLISEIKLLQLEVARVNIELHGTSGRERGKLMNSRVARIVEIEYKNAAIRQVNKELQALKNERARILHHARMEAIAARLDFAPLQAFRLLWRLQRRLEFTEEEYSVLNALRAYLFVEGLDMSHDEDGVM